MSVRTLFNERQIPSSVLLSRTHARTHALTPERVLIPESSGWHKAKSDLRKPPLKKLKKMWQIARYGKSASLPPPPHRWNSSSFFCLPDLMMFLVDFRGCHQFCRWLVLNKSFLFVGKLSDQNADSLPSKSYESRVAMVDPLQCATPRDEFMKKQHFLYHILRQF